MPIRRPTTVQKAYAWHSAALRGERPAVHENEPQCGWYRRKLVKNGHWVPAKIWLVQSICPETGELLGPELLRCTVRDREAVASEEWLWLAKSPISEADYEAMWRQIEMCEWNDPAHPCLHPNDPIPTERRYSFGQW